jgi:hypothetical protein
LPPSGNFQMLFQECVFPHMYVLTTVPCFLNYAVRRCFLPLNGFFP